MYILTNKYSFPSARILAEYLSNKTKTKIKLTSNPEKINNDFFIRYGNSFNLDSNNDLGLNNKSFIKLVSNKLNFSKLLIENDILTPHFVGSEEKPLLFPVLIRKTLTSSGGRGIVLCRNEDEFNINWKDGYYWTPFFNTSWEGRAHVLNGEIIKLFIKVFNGETEDEFPIRNLHNGYHFSLRNTEGKFSKLKDIVHRLNDLINGEYYALDVGFSEGFYIIFEANSAPGLNYNTANLYADYISKRLNL
jgi:glutathione synthase/RimK-type ligase-like ATP-grasp enzyme